MANRSYLYACEDPADESGWNEPLFACQLDVPVAWLALVVPEDQRSVEDGLIWAVPRKKGTERAREKRPFLKQLLESRLLAYYDAWLRALEEAQVMWLILMVFWTG